MPRVGDVDAEFGLAAQHGIGDAGRCVIENLDPVAGAPGRVLLDDARQVVHPRGRHAGDRDVAALRLAGFQNFRKRGLEILQQPLCLRQKIAPDRGQRHRARGSLDKFNAQDRFQMLQASGQRGLRNVQCVGGFLEAVVVSDGNERLDAERVDFHEYIA